MYKSEVLTESECLWDQVSHARLLDLIGRASARILNIVESENSHGEFLFVTVQFPSETLEFYGAGYHWQKERWISDSWRVFDTHPYSGNRPQDDKAAALRTIERARQYAAAQPQPERTKRADLYETLSLFSDEDGALSMMEDYDQ